MISSGGHLSGQTKVTLHQLKRHLYRPAAPLRLPQTHHHHTLLRLPRLMLSSDLESFQKHLLSSKKILALVGAGLSQSSGLPTFRGEGGIWRNYDAAELATPEAFHNDPSTVWQFYAHRRHMSLMANPNAGHYALAELARRLPGRFLTLTQNVDGLSSRANHPPEALLKLHGDLFALRCTSFFCSYSTEDNVQDPITPALNITDNYNSAKLQRHKIPVDELPTCPQCKEGLLRPGVVWFGESLPFKVMDTADEFLMDEDVDLIIVVGTSGSVWPAAGYVERVALNGGKVAIFNMEIDHYQYGESEAETTDSEDSSNEDAVIEGWAFKGNATEWLPKALEPIIGRAFMKKRN